MHGRIARPGDYTSRIFDHQRPETLDTARSNYTLATWYVRYARGGADTAGMKVAHNPEATMEYYSHAIELVEEGVGLLS